ncbi:hypothetical protein HPP92_009809 [Vanilla planifolia]|uniref:Uncharacterized protein n=1 Tax=Vanilla planifolia TaxID=51239 RepID=A0A835RD25_VANPL|nr:hypothetical protein HPP92_009809 [Vanilla planifolia]
MELTLIEDGLSQLEKPSLVTEIILSTDPGSFWTLTFILLVGVGATAIGVLLSKIHLPRFRRRKALIPLPSFYSFGEDDDDDISLSHTDDEEEVEETDMEGEEKSGEFNEEDDNQVKSLFILLLHRSRGWNGCR